jgi:hypothetical protein
LIAAYVKRRLSSPLEQECQPGKERYEQHPKPKLKRRCGAGSRGGRLLRSIT